MTGEPKNGGPVNRLVWASGIMLLGAMIVARTPPQCRRYVETLPMGYFPGTKRSRHS